jgi:hypothetical protein
MKNHLRLFPYIKDKQKAEKLQIDSDSIHYITVREYAIKISEIIGKHVSRIGKNSRNMIITDATAGCGGDTLTFAKHFNKVYSIEINKTRYDHLVNNIKQYNFTNITLYNDSCLNIVNTITKQDIIYVDPPWEPNGQSYKNKNNLTLPFCGMQLEHFCNKLFDVSYMECIPMMVVLKLPKNYDMQHFYDTILNKHVYYYDLGKMIILVLLNNNIII